MSRDEERKDKKRNARAALDPLLTSSAPQSASGPSRLDIVSRAIMAPFTHKRGDSTKIFSDSSSPVFHASRTLELTTLIFVQSHLI